MPRSKRRRYIRRKAPTHDTHRIVIGGRFRPGVLFCEGGAFGSVQFESDGAGEFPLTYVEAVQAIDAQFEGGGHVQHVRTASAQPGGRLPRQPQRPLEHGIRENAQLEDSVAQIAFEIFQRRFRLLAR